MPIQSPVEDAAGQCSSCGAAIVADQRYCLSCGQPCSPVRLAFLDVLQSDSQPQQGQVIVTSAADYQLDDRGAMALLRRNSGLFGLLTVLLVTGLIGLLIGHWTSASRTPGTQVLKIEGLPQAALSSAPASSSTPATGTPSSTTSSSSTTPANETQEKKEVQEAEAQATKAKAPAPVKTSSSKLGELSKLTGRKHEQAIEKLVQGDKPIETGG